MGSVIFNFGIDNFANFSPSAGREAYHMLNLLVVSVGTGNDNIIEEIFGRVE